ncbi:MAG: hypothetical protein HFJ24_05670 [Clostridia bacterium]|nr:hypothetical protein [Clostridia bacterium]MCI9275443.1 hypothetical protein [Clostridia bacterium]
MIVEALVNLITVVIKLLAVPFNILPDTPSAVVDAVNYYFDLIFSNLDFLNFFVHVDTLKNVATIAIIVWTVDKTFSLLMWIIHKLPFSIE